MKKPILLFIIFFMSINAGGLKVSKTDKEIMRLVMNGEWIAADSIISQQLTKNPNSPKYLFMKAPLYHYALYINRGGLTRDTVLTLIEYYSQKAIAAAEEMKPTTELNFYTGCAYGYLSRAYGMQRQYWNAYWAAKDCRSYLESVLEKDPEYYDAYMGLAVIEYYTGARLTGFMSTIAWLVGMSGDRQLGLDYMKTVMDKGVLFNDEAHFALSVLYRFLENDLTKAIELMDSFLLKYPDNEFIATNRQRLEIQLIIDREGIQKLLAEKDSLIEKYNIDNSFVLNAIGYSYMGQNDLDKALSIFQLNCELFPAVANCFDSLAECFMNRGEYNKSIKCYKIAMKKVTNDETIPAERKQEFIDRVEEQLDELQSLASS